MASLSARWIQPMVDADRNFVRDSWDKLCGLPGGKVMFSRLVGMAAPYTGTIPFRVEELRHGYSEITMADKRAVRNHLRSVHAIALANLVELTGNIALAYTLPDDGRFIVAGMSLDYVKKARGTITGICECPMVTTNEEREIDVPVSLSDARGNVVVRATLRSKVGPKKR